MKSRQYCDITLPVARHSNCREQLLFSTAKGGLANGALIASKSWGRAWKRRILLTPVLSLSDDATSTGELLKLESECVAVEPASRSIADGDAVSVTEVCRTTLLDDDTSPFIELCSRCRMSSADLIPSASGTALVADVLLSSCWNSHYYLSLKSVKNNILCQYNLIKMIICCTYGNNRT
jgi:hypothetical protein